MFGLMALTVALVTFEHYTFGRWWAGNEFARRTMGHATLLAVALLGLAHGLVDWQSWLVFLMLTGSAGAAKSGLVVHEKEKKKRQRSAALRNEVDEYYYGPLG
jgi:hypothetical protein